MQRLISACRFGNVQTLRAACVHLEKSNLDTVKLSSEFEQLCINNQFDMAREMISQNLMSTEDLVTCFAFACMQYDVATTRFLWLQIERQSFNIWRDTVFCSTHFNISQPNIQILRFLWDNDLCSQSQQTQLHAIQFACLTHNNKHVQFLLQRAELPVQMLRANHNFLFCCACNRGDLALVKTLWLHKLVSRKDQSWLRCALGHAKIARRTHIVRFLESQSITSLQHSTSFDDKHGAHAQLLTNIARSFQC